jgi:hypothetical protein
VPSAQTNFILEKMDDVQQKLAQLLTHFDSVAADVKVVTNDVRSLR